MAEPDLTASREATTSERRRRRRTVVKYSLVGAVLLGIGAGATSAAWTDDAWFSASMTSASVELRASADTPVNFVDADTSAAAVVVPAATFQNMLPNQVRTYTLRLQNTSTVPLTVPAPVFTGSGALFAAPKPLVVTFSPTVGTLAVGAQTTVTMTVTAPDWLTTDTAYQAAAGSGTIRFTGTA